MSNAWQPHVPVTSRRNRIPCLVQLIRPYIHCGGASDVGCDGSEMRSAMMRAGPPTTWTMMRFSVAVDEDLTTVLVSYAYAEPSGDTSSSPAPAGTPPMSRTVPPCVSNFTRPPSIQYAPPCPATTVHSSRLLTRVVASECPAAFTSDTEYIPLLAGCSTTSIAFGDAVCGGGVAGPGRIAAGFGVGAVVVTRGGVETRAFCADLLTPWADDCGVADGVMVRAPHPASTIEMGINGRKRDEVMVVASVVRGRVTVQRPPGASVTRRTQQSDGGAGSLSLHEHNGCAVGLRNRRCPHDRRRSDHELAKQRMRPAGSRPELRVKLRADEERMVAQLDDLDQPAVW